MRDVAPRGSPEPICDQPNTNRLRSDRLLARWRDSRAGRALAWHGQCNGNLLCGGIAYSALFSLFAGSQAAAWGVRLGGAAVGVVIDAAVVIMVITVVGGARPARRALVVGGLAAGVVAGALRWLGTTIVIGSAGANRLLAPFAAIVTILVLVNFVARLLLLTCAWMCDPPRTDVPDEA